MNQPQSGSQPDGDSSEEASNGSSPTPASSYARYSSVGLQFSAMLAAFVYGGYWLDERYGWSPWGILTGTVLGFVGATVWLYREIYPSPPRS